MYFSISFKYICIYKPVFPQFLLQLLTFFWNQPGNFKFTKSLFCFQSVGPKKVGMLLLVDFWNFLFFPKTYNVLIFILKNLHSKILVLKYFFKHYHNNFQNFSQFAWSNVRYLFKHVIFNLFENFYLPTFKRNRIFKNCITYVWKKKQFLKPCFNLFVWKCSKCVFKFSRKKFL